MLGNESIVRKVRGIRCLVAYARGVHFFGFPERGDQ